MPLLLIPLLSIALTLIAPYWVKWALLLLNLCLPDIVPYLEETLQACAIFSATPKGKILHYLTRTGQRWRNLRKNKPTNKPL